MAAKAIFTGTLASRLGCNHNSFMEFAWLKVPQWEKYQTLLHGFMGRRGGKSVGPYAGLNVSYRVGDDAKIVSQNVCDMKLAVGIHDGRIITMKQIHGDQIIDVKDRNIKEAGEGDGMKTGEKEAFLAILTADCVPILFVAPEAKIVAVVHAGWRGTLAGIAPKMVRFLDSQHGISPDAIEAALGPAIGPCCYEVKEDVSRPLVERWGKIAELCVEGRDGKTYLDLRRLNRAILEQAGVGSQQIYQVGPCTSCAPDEFFSYRREKKETGRQISFIGWTS
ncbi:MAG TPA: peptidoglycan editing factor PgeF [Candidatus Binatia bacterium]|nr:peptidoglycan editing factor PgeF [Candidatus Binatia bacterium]